MGSAETAVGGLDLMQRVATDQICQLAAGTPAREHIGDARRFMSTLNRVYLFEKAPRLLMRMPKVRRFAAAAGAGVRTDPGGP